MAITPYEFRETKGQFFDLEPLKTDEDDWITAIAVTIQGICGSANERRRKLPERYRLLVDLTQLRQALPIIWVVLPADADIQHVNIFPASSVCPFTGGSLPTLCWGITPSAWSGVSVAERSLSNLLEAARQVLANTNMNSRAR